MEISNFILIPWNLEVAYAHTFALFPRSNCLEECGGHQSGLFAGSSVLLLTWLSLSEESTYGPLLTKRCRLTSASLATNLNGLLNEISSSLVVRIDSSRNQVGQGCGGTGDFTH